MIGRHAGALLPACAMLTLAAPARTQTPRPGFVLPWRPHRFDENYAHLRDSVPNGWWQRLKCPGSGAHRGGAAHRRRHARCAAGLR